MTPTPSQIGDAFAPLTTADIEGQTDSGSFSRGRSYFRGGHIIEPILRAGTIEAQCLGSDPAPYRVTATLAPAGDSGENPRTVSCTCPRGGFCKHIVALLLTWIDDPSRFTQLPPVAEQLAGRSPAELTALIERMIHRHPDLQRLLDLPIPVPPGAAPDVPANQVTIDTAPIRKQVRAALATYDPFDDEYALDAWGWWDEIVSVPDEIAEVEVLAQSYVDAGQWANALAVCVVLIEESLDILPTIDDQSGGIATIVIEADRRLSACLNAQADLPEDQQLSPDQREELLRTVYAIWQADILEFGGIDLSQHGTEAIVRDTTTAERVMVEGWLREELTGDVTGDWSRAAVIGFLVDLRQASGASDEELLELYRDAELWDDVAMMLISMDRIDEAIATAARHVRIPSRLTRIADTLITYGAAYASRAIGMVDDLLWEIEGQNAGHDGQLQAWLLDRYGAHGREQDALAMARRRFERQPHFRTFAEVEHAARLPGQPAGTWEAVRPELLHTLRAKDAWADLIEIHLAAGEASAALEALDTLETKRQQPTAQTYVWSIHGGSGERAVRVAALAERQFPDRANAIYQREADRRIEQRGRSNYQVAAEYLARVKAILEREGREREWRTIIGHLRDDHKRLRALQDELDKRQLS